MVSRRGLAIWIATILLALVFVLVGSSKLAGPSAVRWAERFVNWGYPRIAVRLVGTLEIVAGIALLVPRARRRAAAVIVATMMGALMTHLVHGEFSRVIPPLVLGGLAFFLYRSSRLLSGARSVASRHE